MSGLRTGLVGVVMALALTACGGDASSGGAGMQPVTPATPVTPPVTPPPVTFSYDKASDFTRDRSFSAIGTTATLVYAPDGAGFQYMHTAALDAESDAIGFDYVASSRTYRARYLGDTFEQATTPITTTAVPYDEYAEPTTGNAIGLYFARTPLRAGLDYVGFVLWRLAQPQPMQVGSATRIHRMQFGSRTLQADLPTSGTATYDANVEVTENESADITVPRIGVVRTTTARIVIDWQTRAVSGYVRLFPPSGTGTSLQSPVDYSVGGRIADDGLLTGTIGLPGAVGMLQGRVYGPRAVEVGLLFTYRNSTISTQQHVGAVLGHQ